MKVKRSELERVPGVGKSIARDLEILGYKKIDDLKRQDPEEMYIRLCQLQNAKLDRCLLYVFRCAVYFASHTKHDAELLRWWAWKDKK